MLRAFGGFSTDFVHRFSTLWTQWSGQNRTEIKAIGKLARAFGAFAKTLHRAIDVLLHDIADNDFDVASLGVATHLRQHAENDAARRTCHGRDALLAARALFARAKRHGFETMWTFALENRHVQSGVLASRTSSLRVRVGLAANL